MCEMRNFPSVCVIVMCIFICSVQDQHLSIKWIRYPSLDGYEAFPRTTETAGSIVHCGTKCRHLRCQSFFYISERWTSNCLLYDKTLPNNSEMTLSSNTKYYTAIFNDCAEALTLGFDNSGVYLIHPTEGGQMNVRCDMAPLTGGWIVIQRRINASDFYKTWDEYKTGFGDLNGNFWMGNENIWSLTKTGSWKLRIDLTLDDESGYAEYSSFAIGNEVSNYAISIAGYSGSIGDSLGSYNGVPFTTKDRDNDMYASANCAELYLGGWWYNSCHSSNLNGDYGNKAYGKGLNWIGWKGPYQSMTTTNMKIKKII